MQNFYFDKVDIEAATAGDVKFAGRVGRKNSKITAADNTKISISENAAQ